MHNSTFDITEIPNEIAIQKLDETLRYNYKRLTAPSYVTNNFLDDDSQTLLRPEVHLFYAIQAEIINYIGLLKNSYTPDRYPFPISVKALCKRSKRAKLTGHSLPIKTMDDLQQYNPESLLLTKAYVVPIKELQLIRGMFHSDSFFVAPEFFKRYRFKDYDFENDHYSLYHQIKKPSCSEVRQNFLPLEYVELTEFHSQLQKNCLIAYHHKGGPPAFELPIRELLVESGYLLDDHSRIRLKILERNDRSTDILSLKIKIYKSDNEKIVRSLRVLINSKTWQTVKTYS
jgi:hypothetical protein